MATKPGHVRALWLFCFLHLIGLLLATDAPNVLHDPGHQVVSSAPQVEPGQSKENPVTPSSPARQDHEAKPMTSAFRPVTSDQNGTSPFPANLVNTTPLIDQTQVFPRTTLKAATSAFAMTTGQSATPTVHSAPSTAQLSTEPSLLFTTPAAQAATSNVHTASHGRTTLGAGTTQISTLTPVDKTTHNLTTQQNVHTTQITSNTTYATHSAPQSTLPGSISLPVTGGVPTANSTVPATTQELATHPLPTVTTNETEATTWVEPVVGTTNQTGDVTSVEPTTWAEAVEITTNQTGEVVEPTETPLETTYPTTAGAIQTTKDLTIRPTTPNTTEPHTVITTSITTTSTTQSWTSPTPKTPGVTTTQQQQRTSTVQHRTTQTPRHQTTVTMATTTQVQPTTEETMTPTPPHPPSLFTLPTPAMVTPNASYHLSAYIQLRLSTRWSLFCAINQDIRDALSEYANEVLGLSRYHRVSASYLNVFDYCRSVMVNRMRRFTTTPIPVDFYVALNSTYHENSTRKVGAELVNDPSNLQEDIPFQIQEVYLLTTEQQTTDPPTPPDDEAQGMVVAVTLTVCALVFGIILSLIGFKVYRIRKSQTSFVDRYYFDGKQLQDALSESHQMRGVSSPSRTGVGLSSPTYRGYFTSSINHGLVIDDEETVLAEEEEPEEALPSHYLTESALTKFYSYREAIEEEFENLPGHHTMYPDVKKKITPKLRHLVHQSPSKTRVPVPTSPGPTKADCTIDASYVRGQTASGCKYIAAKVTGPDSPDSFWKMVWEQQSRTVVCLCSPYELGKVCLQYWPSKEGGPGAQLYGSILVTLKGGASGEHYFTSSLLVRNIEKTLCRPVTHYWFTNWVDGDIPSNGQALMSMLLQVHSTHQESYGPVIVHCSDGVGRTGMVIATDINMQRLEDSHCVDIPRTVSAIRQDRGQAVANADQYAFIYKTVHEFSKFLSTAHVKETSDTESVAHENAEEYSDTANEDLSSLATNSSRASSYLGDLSSTVRRKLALKFPSLGISPPPQPSPTKSAKSPGEFVVFNSPKAANLDVSVVSGLSSSGKGEGHSSGNSELQFRFDQASFSIQNEESSSSQENGDPHRVHPHSSSLHQPERAIDILPVSSVLASRDSQEPDIWGASSSTGPEHGFSQYHGSGDFGFPAPQSARGIGHRYSPAGSSGHSETFPVSSRRSDSFMAEEDQGHHYEPVHVIQPFPQPHTREPSYPVSLNPFDDNSFGNSLDIPLQQHQDFVQSTSTNSASSHGNPMSSDPVFHAPLTSLDDHSVHSYPQENNPFDNSSEADDNSIPASSSPASLNSTFVLVSHPDDAELIARQTSYPRGLNPFEDSMNRSGSHGRASPMVNRGLRLVSAPFRRNKKSGGPDACPPTACSNPFGDDWMDDAEESFT
ncbi:uncharacterized protein [Diadema antillarum]|uniref:uncharacterized protein n=1 Tax=Diadema antillarum TaxID=105358 RepID=UPI003A86E16D